ncbi:MAG: ROK family transcriptional regulator [Bacteroidetes bacterium]|nr:ROK family transcriptional regulator [Bacteroidota bacterium]
MKIKKKKTSQILSINPKIGRNINRSIILNTIRSKQPISRSAISRLTGLNKSTVSGIVTSLLQEGLVEEDVLKNQIVGRNPLNLTIKKNTNYVGSIVIDLMYTSVAVVDVDGSIVEKKIIPAVSKNPKKRIDESFQELKKLHPESTLSTLRGIGITTPGIVDTVQSKVLYASNLGWKNVDLAEIIRHHDLQADYITIENNAKASALAEVMFGRYEIDQTNFIFLLVGSGIGAGIVIDNQILSGNSHAAGEYGHMMLIEGGKQCACGNRGCWEMYASEKAIVDTYLEKAKIHNATIDEIITKSLTGDSAATASLIRAAEYLGLGISHIINTFDPKYIILGGTIIRAWSLIQPVINTVCTAREYFQMENKTKIVPSSRGDDSVLLGAAALPIQKIFQDYKIAL